jgi:hypothetical protein
LQMDLVLNRNARKGNGRHPSYPGHNAAVRGSNTHPGPRPSSAICHVLAAVFTHSSYIRKFAVLSLLRRCSSDALFIGCPLMLDPNMLAIV